MDVKLHNNTRDAVVIESFVTSCSCVNVTPGSVTLSPHSSEIIRCSLDLTQNDDDLVTPIYSYDAMIIPSPPSGTVLPIKLSGKIYRPFRIESNRLHIDAWNEDWSAPQVINGESLLPLASLTAECDLPGIEVKIVGIEASMSSFALNFDFSARSNEARAVLDQDLQFSVWLSGQDKGGTRFPKVEVPVIANFRGDLSVAPDTITPGLVCVGTKWSELVRLSSRSNSDFEVLSVACPNGIAADAQLGTTGAGFAVQVDGEVGMSGHFESELTIHVAYKTGEEADVRIPISFIGRKLD